MSKRLIVVDLSNFIFRAFYAIRPLSTPDGTPVNAVYGVFSMMQKILQEYGPDYLVIAQDTKEKSFRHKMYSEYKANRTEPPEDLIPQFELVEELLVNMGMKCVKAPGFEADDIIGTCVRVFEDQVDEILLATGDKDLMQFVGPKVKMLDTMKSKILGVEEVKAKMGVLPEQIVDYLSLVGDSSDNIPGVKGIGAKGAGKLLEEYQSLENVFANIDKISNKRVLNGLQNHREDADLSKKLIQIACEVPINVELEDLAYSFEPSESLRLNLEILGFKSQISKLFNSAGNQSKQIEKKRNENTFKLGKKEFLKEISEGEFSLFQDGNSLYCAGKTGVFHYEGEEKEQVQRELLTNKKLKFFTDEPKKHFLIALRNDFEVGAVLFDTQLAHFNLDPGRKHNIEFIAQELCPGRFDFESDEVERVYAESLFEVGQILEKKLEEFEVVEVFNELDTPLNKVLATMEYNGILLDTDFYKDLEIRFTEEITKIKETIYELTELDTNLNSPKQVSELLFEKLALPIIKKTKTGASTDSSVLSKLVEMDVSPVPELILKFREIDKLLSTYVKTFPHLINEGTKRLHTNFRQDVAATGRLSSENPNLQNIPIRTEKGRLLRQGFVVPKDYTLVTADYSQVELRILAHFSEDPTMVKSFQEEIDIHTQTASEIFSIPLNQVDSEMRGRAKAINFGLIYGQSSFGLSQTLNIPRNEAREYIDFYFERFGSVKAYLDSLREACESKGYAETLYGRKRLLPDIHSKNRTVKSMAERMAINSPIQGTAADIIKKAMLHVDRELVVKDLKSRLLLQIHDELVLEVPDEEVDVVKEMVQSVMESVVTLKVPLKVDVGTGSNWLEAK
jgi:DNA polymerase-1